MTQHEAENDVDLAPEDTTPAQDAAEPDALFAFPGERGVLEEVRVTLDAAAFR